MLLASDIFTVDHIVAFIGGAVICAGALIAAMSKRGRDLTSGWENTYKLAKAENDERERAWERRDHDHVTEIARLKGRLDFFESGFFKSFGETTARTIVQEVTRLMKEQQKP